MSMDMAVLGIGLVTSVGATAPATCAAIRAKLSNPVETAFACPNDEWINGRSVLLDRPWRGTAKLSVLAAMVIEEALSEVPAEKWNAVTVILCLAEADRPGLIAGAAEKVFTGIQRTLGVRFSSYSSVMMAGSVGIALALLRARDLVHGGSAEQVLIVGADSLLTWPTLRAYLKADRLVVNETTDGMIPGEAAGALLVGRRSGAGQLLCLGIGTAFEEASIDSGEPLMAVGLGTAIRRAVTEAQIGLQDVAFRVTDMSGELYCFKEAELAIGRILRAQRPTFEMWHPGESVGEVGAAIGMICVAVVAESMKKGYAPGYSALLHFGTDSGQRAAMVCSLSGA